jgi:hypothetical protein
MKRRIFQIGLMLVAIIASDFMAYEVSNYMIALLVNKGAPVNFGDVVRSILIPCVIFGNFMFLWLSLKFFRKENENENDEQVRQK